MGEKVRGVGGPLGGVARSFFVGTFRWALVPRAWEGGGEDTKGSELPRGGRQHISERLRRRNF